MPNLVASLPDNPAEPIPINECLALVQEAHDYLVTHSIRAIKAIRIDEKDSYWGMRIKRVQVDFPAIDRPRLIDTGIAHHSLTEVYNQCATMERLLDALAWCNDVFPDFQVAVCHPTTGSAKSGHSSSIPDNDLVLVNASVNLSCFEVSDVSGLKDSNQKEAKDLKSLGQPFGEMKRTFLVVSPELSNILRRKKHPSKMPDYRYFEHDTFTQTGIFEVIPAEER